MYTIVFTGWEEGLKKIALTNLLRQYTDMSLSSAKRTVDSVLNGEKEHVQCRTKRNTEYLIKKAGEIGAKCSLNSQRMMATAR